MVYIILKIAKINVIKLKTFTAKTKYMALLISLH